jgi:hypothetical protein
MRKVNLCADPTFYQVAIAELAWRPALQTIDDWPRPCTRRD